MYRIATWAALFVMCFFPEVRPSETVFSIRAASAEAVDGWQQMQVEHSTRTVWVSPVEAVVASDIEKAQPMVRGDGDRVISVIFTDEGAAKMRDLTTVQFKKLIVMVVDGKVVWAPYVQAVAGKSGILTGNQPGGLTEEEVTRIMAGLNQRN